MTINEIQDGIIEEFSGLDDWMDKYQLLIDLGNELTPLDERYKTEQNLIDGCQSRVWLQADLVDGVIHFTAELYFIEEIGLKEHLSPTRSNGLVAMVKQIRTYALAFGGMKH